MSGLLALEALQDGTQKVTSHWFFLWFGLMNSYVNSLSAVEQWCILEKKNLVKDHSYIFQVNHLCINLPHWKPRQILLFISSCDFQISLFLPTLYSPQSISLISHSVVEPSEIVVGEVLLLSTKVTIIFSSVCVSDMASARGSTSHIIQFLTTSEVFTRLDNDITDKGSTASAPPLLSPPVQLISPYL